MSAAALAQALPAAPAYSANKNVDLKNFFVAHQSGSASVTSAASASGVAPSATDNQDSVLQDMLQAAVASGAAAETVAALTAEIAASQSSGLLQSSSGLTDAALFMQQLNAREKDKRTEKERLEQRIELSQVSSQEADAIRAEWAKRNFFVEQATRAAAERRASVVVIDGANGSSGVANRLLCNNDEIDDEETDLLAAEYQYRYVTDVHDSLSLLKWMSSFNLLLAVIGIVLMILTRELQHNYNDPAQLDNRSTVELIVNVARCGNTLVTLVLLYFLFQYHRLENHLQKYTTGYNEELSVWHTSRLWTFGIEFCVCAIHDMPFLSWDFGNVDISISAAEAPYMQFASFSGPIKYASVPMDSPWALFMLLRLYLIGRVMRDRAFSSGANLLGMVSDFPFNTAFAIRAIIESSPFATLGTFTFILLACGSYSLHVCERAWTMNTDAVGNAIFPLWNRSGVGAAWIIFNTATTIGMGEINPLTVCGRVVCVLTAFFGVCLISSLLSALTSLLELRPFEARMVDFIELQRRRSALRSTASSVIACAWRRYRFMKVVATLPDTHEVHRRRAALQRAVSVAMDAFETARQAFTSWESKMEYWQLLRGSLYKIGRRVKCAADHWFGADREATYVDNPIVNQMTLLFLRQIEDADAAARAARLAEAHSRLVAERAAKEAERAREEARWEFDADATYEDVSRRTAARRQEYEYEDEVVAARASAQEARETAVVAAAQAAVRNVDEFGAVNALDVDDLLDDADTVSIGGSRLATVLARRRLAAIAAQRLRVDQLRLVHDAVHRGKRAFRQRVRRARAHATRSDDVQRARRAGSEAAQASGDNGASDTASDTGRRAHAWHQTGVDDKYRDDDDDDDDGYRSQFASERGDADAGDHYAADGQLSAFDDIRAKNSVSAGSVHAAIASSPMISASPLLARHLQMPASGSSFSLAADRAASPSLPARKWRRRKKISELERLRQSRHHHHHHLHALLPPPPSQSYTLAPPCIVHAETLVDELEIALADLVECSEDVASALKTILIRVVTIEHEIDLVCDELHAVPRDAVEAF